VVRARLGPGVDPARAIAEILQLAGGVGAAIRPGSQHPVDQRDDYVRWAIDTEAHLESVLRRQDAQAFFDNPRHRDILVMPLGNYLTTLIYAELEAKRRALADVVTDLRAQVARMTGAPGFPIVVDSNVLLQCQRLDSVTWPTEVGEARVIVPLRVMEEIDAKKYGDNKRLRGVARGVVTWIDSLFPGGGPGPVRIRDGRGDTIELLLADRPRYRPMDADEEVLDAAHEVAQFARQVVKVMTADTAMRVRARHEGLDVLRVPDEWLRIREDAAEE